MKIMKFQVKRAHGITFVGEQNRFLKISSAMVTCYVNKCHYSCSGTNNIINIKTEYESHSLCSTDFIPNPVIIPA